MADKILCPGCNKINDVHKFCVFCGHKLLDDEQIELILDNPDPYCLNCGRPVKKNQAKCECGYEFGDINCPGCNTKNSYTNRFCTTCGKKLWTSNVDYYKYPKRLFEKHILKEVLPYPLRNTSLYGRSKMNFKSNAELHAYSQFTNIKNTQTELDKYLCEIGSRWKVISPHYCINCLNIIKPTEYSCSKCESGLFADEKRVVFLQSENKYVEPKFDNVDLKWAPKFSNNYLNSLAPAIGESQFEYRERLKWEFAENKYRKKQEEERERQQAERKRQAEERKRLQAEYERRAKERRKWEQERIRQFGGGYCDYSCRYFYEEFFDSMGGIVGDMCADGYTEYYCHRGHSVNIGSYCEDYE